MSLARHALNCLGLYGMSRFGRPDRGNILHIVLEWKGAARVHYRGRALQKRGLLQSDLHRTEWKGFIQTSSLIALQTQPRERFDAGMDFITHTVAEVSHSFISDVFNKLSKI